MVQINVEENKIKKRMHRSDGCTLYTNLLSLIFDMKEC